MVVYMGCKDLMFVLILSEKISAIRLVFIDLTSLFHVIDYAYFT